MRVDPFGKHGFIKAWDDDPISRSAEVRRVVAQYEQPSLRVFGASTGAADLKIRRVGKVRREQLIRYHNSFNPVVITTMGGERFKFMPVVGPFSKLTVSFQSAKTGKETLLGTIRLGDDAPFVHTASGADAYIARNEPNPSGRNSGDPVKRAGNFLRVEQAFEAQTQAELVAEFRDFDDVYNSRGTRGGQYPSLREQITFMGDQDSFPYDVVR